MRHKTRDIAYSSIRSASKDEIAEQILLAKDGDRGAFEFVYKYYYSRMLNHIIRRGFSRQEAEEIYNDIFMGVSNKFSIFKA